MKSYITCKNKYISLNEILYVLTDLSGEIQVTRKKGKFVKGDVKVKVERNKKRVKITIK